jgi:hypothetical protein
MGGCGPRQSIPTRRRAGRCHDRARRERRHHRASGRIPAGRRRAVGPYERLGHVASRAHDRRYLGPFHGTAVRCRRGDGIPRRDQRSAIEDLQADGSRPAVRQAARSRVPLSRVHRLAGAEGGQCRRYRGARRHDRAGARDADGAHHRGPSGCRERRHRAAGTADGWIPRGRAAREEAGVLPRGAGGGPRRSLDGVAQLRDRRAAGSAAFRTVQQAGTGHQGAGGGRGVHRGARRGRLWRREA